MSVFLGLWIDDALLHAWSLDKDGRIVCEEVPIVSETMCPESPPISAISLYSCVLMPSLSRNSHQTEVVLEGGRGRTERG